MSKEKKILISSGGTGGHVIPALSLYDFLKDENYIVKLSTDLRGMAYIENIKIPVTVLRAQTRKKTQDSMDFSGSPTWKYLSSCFFNGRDISVPHLTHFIPMQNPELTAKYILDKL